MATTIVTKYGSDAPAASDIVRGELAVDTENGRLYTENSSGAVVEIGLNPEGNVDVTGTVTTTGNVKIGDSATDVTSKLTVSGNASADVATFMYDGAAGTYLDIDCGAANGDVTIAADARSGSYPPMVFKTGAAERMRIDASGNVGIGRTPVNTLNPSLELVDGGSLFGFGNSLYLAANLYYAGGWKAMATGAGASYVFDSEHKFYTNASVSANATATPVERMRIDSSGNVGIGNSSPPEMLTIGDTSNTYTRIQFLSSTTGGNTIHFGDGTSADAYRGYINYTHSDDALAFAAGGSEAMRISGGSVGIGNSTVASTRFAVTGSVVGANIETTSSTAGHEALIINRQNSDGTAIAINKAGTTIGSIGVNGSTPFISPTVAGGIRFTYTTSTNGAMFPCDTTGANSDATHDIGNGSVRFRNLYATNGTIQTSDRNEKQDIEALSDAEQRVAVAAKGLLRKFRWISSVEEKGDEARTHFGIIAQDLQAAFAAEGLDAGDYAMFINSTWTDEETGEERSRMGVRYSELLAFIIAAI